MMFGLFTKAERQKLGGLITKEENIPSEDQKILATIENSGFGVNFTNRLTVKKFEGPNMQQTDEYVATRKPGSGPGNR